VEPSVVKGTITVSNMGLDRGAELEDRSRQQFCVDCRMPFREGRMLKFRGLWYGIPCGDYLHAIDIYRKERQRAFRPVHRNEPAAVPFILSANW
jgi:hypothetical protein